VRQHDRWKALLTVEIGKAESLMEKENLKQIRRDDRRDIGRKNEIFKHGIKGIKKITGKYNTSKPLTEVKITVHAASNGHGKITPHPYPNRERKQEHWHGLRSVLKTFEPTHSR